ncbi:CASC3/Barentsz eIF4AIII binding-domain-containing protein [Sphaerosporella brunnea]|uniref:CASC3/Barentsz eIF4AIII binding-domain-containing protein n=1 Tax=Sphaerosporella brunnea TaxID=1250544 RepID=A0A5J5EX05_9PEZI|nr:CASC3/Barentsz eIF4AIII binding-domain-containing protein [Sphaerosporella brunnea]
MPAAAAAAAQTPSIAVPAAKAPRRKTAHLPRRRRAGHKHEEDDAETVATDESYTNDSGLSEDDGFSEDETDEEYEDASDGEGRREIEEKQSHRVLNGGSQRRTDTDLMKNGIGAGGAEHEEVDFEDMGNAPPASGRVVSVREESKKAETPYERKRKEHEQYRKKRAEDPSFVPKRGRFFMHDHRYDGTGSNGFKPFGPGGRGRGGRFGDFQGHQQQPPPPELAGEWPHDMHEQIETEEEEEQPPNQSRTVAAPASTQSQQSQQNQGYVNNNSFAAGRQRAPDQPRSFGRTLHKGTVQIQVNLPGMKAPITFSEVPCKVYTRLPFHRPPLRRDKPVRIALPDAPVRYIYPNVQRSFIFIPRAMRPGGSGYIRGTAGRGRGGYPTGNRSFYGGGSTVYSPSVGMSRRSSLVYDTRHHTPSQGVHPLAPPQHPVGPIEDGQTRAVVNGEDGSGKPIVRLPSTAPSVANAPAQPAGHMQQASTPRIVPQHPPPSYTPSINPIPYRETRATPKIPMYQPRPQKAVNVAEIDSPAVMHFPHNYNGGVYTDHIPAGTPVMAPNVYGQHNRHPSYPSQPSGTPLSQIPEAIHARPFQPGQYPPQQPYYQPYPPPHGHPGPPPPHAMAHAPMQHHPAVFHPPPPPYVAGPSPMPNGAPNHYTMPQPAHPQAGPPTHAGPTTIAQESNGMVYYSTWDPNTAYYQYPPAPGPAYPDASGLSMTPIPDGQGQNIGGPMYYYPPQPTGYYPTH